MTKATTRKSSPKKQPAANETSESIAEQTRLFLKSGKKIDVIKSGISGQPTLGARKAANLRSGS
ncbi:MAG: hypothetical protein AAGI11_19755 [Pseudomonadota bacterium]